MNGKELIKQCLIRKQNKRYEREVRRQHEDYDTWIRRIEREEKKAGAEKNGRNGAASHSLEGGGAEFVWMPSLAGQFSPEAEKEVGIYFETHPECMLAYADEDILETENGRRSTPWFKPDWSPDTFLAYDYLGNAAAVRSTFLAKCGYRTEDITRENRRKILYSCMKKCGGFRPKCNAVGHIEQILFHGKSAVESQEPYWRGTETDMTDFCDEAEWRRRQEEKNSLPKVSVIIPSKDNVSVLKQCILSVVQTAGAQEIEFIVVDNGSCKDTVEKLHKLKEDLINMRYLYQPMEFNFSKMCNLGAEAAEGEYFLFLNDDTQAVNKGWLDAMLQKAALPYAGAVGMKLLYPDNNRIQHTGVVNLPMGPVHKLQFLPDSEEYYFGWNQKNRNVLAVTGACLMMKRERFLETGGFCEELKVAFNDVALCFTLYEAGYHNVVINQSFLYHHESLSRGNDETEEKWKRLMAEREKLYERHPALQGKDPYYSQRLNRNGLDTRILPGNEDSSEGADKVTPTVLLKEPEYDRQDECLLLRLERVEKRNIQGYAVVLGSNNACFEIKLILKREGEDGSGAEYGYELAFPPAYRSDLKENMPDQENVALAGFHICPEGELAGGSYRIGALARNRISGQKILNFSSRSLTVL